MTDLIPVHLNHALSPIVEAVSENRWASAARAAAHLDANADSWVEALARATARASEQLDDARKERPTASPDEEPGEWADYETSYKNSTARLEAMTALQNAMLHLHNSLRRVADCAIDRACDLEDRANA